MDLPRFDRLHAPFHRFSISGVAVDLREWLRDLGLEQYADTFIENEIGEDTLPRLTVEDLKDLGVNLVGHRRKLLAALAALSSAEGPEAIADPAVGAAVRPVEAERRQLTVVFADLVGSTDLARRLDPEDMSELIRAYQACCADAVNHWEGQVAKYMGDGVLAYFGWPAAHEDDAERAVRAGLELVERVARLEGAFDARLAARVGIATGQVVVGDLIGEGPAQERTVIGETPALAARLQALAEPGAVVIAPRTRRLLGGLFELEDLGACALKGFAEPVPAFRVARELRGESRFEALYGRPLMPLVGRDEELLLLASRWHRAKEGESQVVLLAGEPGIGKSRLCDALSQQLADEPHARLRYQCSPYHRHSALYPVISRLESTAGFRRDDDAGARLAKLEALLAREVEHVSSVAPLFATLLAIPVDGRYPPLNLTPQQLKAKTLQALAAQLETVTAGQPVLLVFEDLHWADPTSLEFLGLALERAQNLPVLAVLTFRPEFNPPWAGRAHTTQLSLSRLTRAHGTAVVERVAGGKPLPAEVIEQILTRTDGVPLFIEELTKAILESGLLEDAGERYVLRGPLPPLAIPATLHDSLMARLDRLGPVKKVAQIAACIGREFSHELLAAVSSLQDDRLEEAVGKLVDSELVLPRGTPPARSYLFRHALVQEAAHASLLRQSRRQLHGGIARTVEERFPEIAELEPEWLARQWTEAGFLEPATDNWLRAARRAKEAFANREAKSHLQKCLEVISSASSGAVDPLADLERRKLEALVLLGDLAGLAGDLEEANSHYEQALDAACNSHVRTWVENKRHRPRFAVRDGARIAFYEHGGGQQTLLFVSPQSYGLGAFQPILERLCQEFRIVTVDARGSGASDPLTRPYPLIEHVRDVRAVVAALGDGPVVGVGISRGSNVLLRLAHREPQLFDKLVTIGAPPSTPESPYFADEYLTRCREAFEAEDLEKLLRVHIAFACSEPEMLELQELIVRGRLQMARETLLSFWDPDPTADVMPILPDIAVPVLVTHGREDRLVSFEAAEHIAARLPNAQLYAFDGKGHFPIFTATEEFCDVLRSFVRMGALADEPAPEAGWNRLIELENQRGSPSRRHG